MQPNEFIAKWQNTPFTESQAAQSFFDDICVLVEHPKVADFADPDAFTFEKKAGAGKADAYLEGHFGWEFKGSDSDLDDALNQLLRYQVHLKTPPLLIVSSFQTIRIQTNFPGMATEQHVIPVASLGQKEQLDKLRWAFHAPAEFRPDRTLDEVTRETANLFYSIVQDMEQHSADSEKLARYLNQIMFCLYAEDAGLLPNSLFTQIVRQHFHNPSLFDLATQNLFGQMAGGGLFGADQVAHFNGDLFKSVDTVEFSLNALYYLEQATQKDWRNIEPSIFGTLFERALDASKRSQLGAHYTGAADIELVVDPVVMEPLRREWDTAQQEVNALADAGNEIAARVRLEAFQYRLASVKVLDPACGSGNFLYTALRSLLDLEKQVVDFNDAKGWDELIPRVQPNQMLGLEINPYATELARTALWIGYIQWHLFNGVHYRREPILTPMDTIRQTDAILDLSDPDNPAEPEWPTAEFIIGNPPFLGGGLLRKQLQDEYVEPLFKFYGDRIPNFSDICCYWFEKARAMLESHKVRRCGLLATQGIRGRANRSVLERIKETGDVFAAYSDRAWILEGAAVHVSIVCFDNGSQTERTLDGQSVSVINTNLMTGADLTKAQRLRENIGISFEGPSPKAPFDITPEIAAEMLAAPMNVNGQPNSDVVRPVMNARDITQRPRGMYTIDFGVDIAEKDAAFYEAPFEHIRTNVKPVRVKNRRNRYAQLWWMFAEARPGMRHALSGLSRYIATPRVSKHRLFVWIAGNTMCNDSNVVFAIDDDYTFGILQSHFHELWALAVGTQLESRPRYTPTTCFETFPFPKPNDAQRAAIAEAAKTLNELRENWLNPPDITETELKKRTLTNLCNERPTWLAHAHATLDAAVADAYGWPADLTDAEILERLLALNLERAAAEKE